MFFPYNQLKKPMKKEAAFIVPFAKWEQEIAELKVIIFNFFCLILILFYVHKV